MSFRLGERFGDIDLRALVPSVLGAAFAFFALFLLVDRLERVAQAQTIAGGETWQATRGSELRLSALQEGPLVGLETSAGAGLTVRAGRAALTDGGPVHSLVWMTPDDKDGDNKAKVQVSVIGSGGSVRLSRAGEASEPRAAHPARTPKLVSILALRLATHSPFRASRSFSTRSRCP